MSERAATATPTPKLLYVVGVVFFFTALLSLMQVLSLIRESFRYTDPTSIAITVAVAVCLAAYGVYLLTRRYRVADWLMYAMTVSLGVQMLMPTQGSAFYSAGQLYLNRALLMLPLVASCLYLARRR